MTETQRPKRYKNKHTRRPPNYKAERLTRTRRERTDKTRALVIAETELRRAANRAASQVETQLSPMTSPLRATVWAEILRDLPPDHPRPPQPKLWTELAAESSHYPAPRMTYRK